jgi:hypothetical protein
MKAQSSTRARRESEKQSKNADQLAPQVDGSALPFPASMDSDDEGSGVLRSVWRVRVYTCVRVRSTSVCFFPTSRSFLSPLVLFLCLNGRIPR